MAMRRADRRDSNIDNELSNPRPKQQEPIPYKDLHQLWLGAKFDLKVARNERDEWKQKVEDQEDIKLQLFNTQQQYQVTQKLYQEANALQFQYLEQCNELQAELKKVRGSMAGIKGWQTRRKNENERLKQQISDMVVLLHDSLKRKEDSINYLYLMGDRMDRIQRLMDSVDEDQNRNPAELLEKLMRVWLAVQKVLAE